ncbi:MAG: transglutaminase domain-containing protein [Thermoguttaceae bacterium]|nr:transglutaminase domain-containing protein [Thermoguttaceae bacterium]MDW8037833.1 transglutaminase domain-containing protein [Thermoguttaceae bacterium]
MENQAAIYPLLRSLRIYWHLLAGVVWTVWLPTETAGAAAPSLSIPNTAVAKSVQYWRFGFVVQAVGNCSGLTATITIPTDWPEQSVRILKEEISPGVRVRYQMVEGAARQMIATIARLEKGAEAKAILTLEVQIGWPEPGDTSLLRVADLKTMPPAIRQYLQPSPLIESNDPEIKALADKIAKQSKDSWSVVEAFYDWVREHIQYKKDSPLKGARAALKDGDGDCDELTALFIALCRAKGIPARTVRVPGHVWAEFYLEDANGQGRWFPCEVAGTRAFGYIASPKPILQKGDALKVRNPRTRQMEVVRFLPETLVVSHFVPGAEPQLKLLCEQTSAPELSEKSSAP